MNTFLDKALFSKFETDTQITFGVNAASDWQLFHSPPLSQRGHVNFYIFGNKDNIY